MLFLYVAWLSIDWVCDTKTHGVNEFHGFHWRLVTSCSDTIEEFSKRTTAVDSHVSIFPRFGENRITGQQTICVIY